MSQRHRTFTLADGTVLTDILGADADENENIDEDSEENEEDEDTGAGGDQDSNDSDDDEDESEDDAKKSKTTLIAERDAALKEKRRAERRMREADRAKSNAETELKALKDGGENELATARDRITELEAELAKRSGSDTTSLIREEFRDLPDTDWHNRKLAFSLLDLSEVSIEDGEVDLESLSDAVEKLKAEHPYLVKTAPVEKDDEQEDEGAKRPARSGDPMRRRKSKEEQSIKQLEGKFPVLAGRF